MIKIIAEVGSNFSSEQDLIDSVGITKQCGADIVKFQLFSQNDLYGMGSEQYNFSPKLFPHLKDKCLEHGIELMCSAFSPGGYDIVNEFVDTHKIASCELSAKDILKTVNEFKKPVIFSNGGSTLKEVHEAEDMLIDCDRTAMWCVGDYPAKIIDFKSFNLFQWAMSGKNKIGFSDHSIDVLNIPVAAKLMGADVIEKHVDFFNSKSPDSPHSLNSFEFSIMCAALKDQTYHLPQQSMSKHKRIYSEQLKRWVRPIL